MYQSFPQNFYTDSSSAMPKSAAYFEKTEDYEKTEKAVENKLPIKKQDGFLSGFLNNFGNIKTEELILIGLVILLLTEENEEWILIALIGFLLFF